MVLELVREEGSLTDCCVGLELKLNNIRRVIIAEIREALLSGGAAEAFIEAQRADISMLV